MRASWRQERAQPKRRSGGTTEPVAAGGRSGHAAADRHRAIDHAAPLTTADVIQLQRAIGNRGVSAVIQRQKDPGSYRVTSDYGWLRGTEATGYEKLLALDRDEVIEVRAPPSGAATRFKAGLLKTNEHSWSRVQPKKIAGTRNWRNKDPQDGWIEDGKLEPHAAPQEAEEGVAAGPVSGAAGGPVQSDREIDDEILARMASQTLARKAGGAHPNLPAAISAVMSVATRRGGQQADFTRALDQQRPLVTSIVHRADALGLDVQDRGVHTALAAIALALHSRHYETTIGSRSLATGDAWKGGAGLGSGLQPASLSTDAGYDRSGLRSKYRV